MCLDVMRAIGREPEALEALLSELSGARGAASRLDGAIDEVHSELGRADGLEARMRSVTELTALAMQGVQLVQHGSQDVAEAFCSSRLGPRWRGAFGTLPEGIKLDAIIDRAVA